MRHPNPAAVPRWHSEERSLVSHAMIRLQAVGDITVVHVLSEEIRHPGPAAELSAELAGLVDGGHRRLVLDLSQTHYLCSTAFAALMGLAKRMQAAAGVVKLYGLDPNVEVGANIIGLGQMIEIHDSQHAALAAF